MRHQSNSLSRIESGHTECRPSYSVQRSMFLLPQPRPQAAIGCTAIANSATAIIQPDPIA
ncbi:hypothetical protein C4K20_1963 [Pseudomonas chlororaphis subsp. aurantiaca]|nr:hypothetical protein C4K20_1963 [Pseudomonas chlororaphis subsp. aurantiaca]